MASIMETGKIIFNLFNSTAGKYPKTKMGNNI